MTAKPWIAVDFDGTLAKFTSDGSIGAPIQPMWDRVNQWLKEGKTVRIFTVRAGDDEQVTAVQKWLKKNNLPVLPITNIKSAGLQSLWDDRAVRVHRNTGKICNGCNSVQHSGHEITDC
ncbi:MAG: hypothetical protein Q7J58_17740 [Hydrogenophaga sp.]|jgi:ATP-dependent RNA circularization protein (DNA/RNA ligase family)|uniref:hypothetical protein n=1 Tax=Hydrogenophaga sp. TaxID=1904254 RepID=UPI002724BC92|nr:hypothetical protein [Hydrogenophaga sp.]MDO9571196.1 hypothetical protein [Hydrogenophaga sp.]MDP3375944.1 hypothetical protein [Hydrogenophaga sp.]